MPESNTPPRIAICIATCRRPESLARLLHGIGELDPVSEAGAALSVYVADNDRGQSARSVCESAQEWLDVPVHYTLEKRPGIPQARNACLSSALGNSDFVAFIDDDEVPDSGWLAELYTQAEATGAAVVTGPATPFFVDEPPSWILTGEHFAPRNLSTGSSLGSAYTNNALVRSDVLSSLDHLFDESMALTGGSDVELFERVAAAGHRIVWADEADVTEWVPASRTRLAWLARRSYREGAAYAFIEQRRDTESGEPVGVRGQQLLHGSYCLVKAALMLLDATTRIATSNGRSDAVWALRMASFGLGRIGGALGRQLQEYAPAHS